MNAPHEIDASVIDERHPWLGLASFSEETRGFFYGREDEVGELARRIQRKLLTVLFGQSGLGKTSILRAGIVPRLRAQGYCPVYVRVDYGPDAPPAAVQIKQAILQATAALGTWSRSGVAAEGESLWEFLHHRDDVLTDEHGKTLLPLLIFDQFEEIFTLAQADDDGRARAAAFIDALSELVENCPSAALEARLEEDDTAVERFDFARSDYRVLIALREDYLAHLESLKGAMPSITQNRMRLAPMTGGQALAAVRGPGAELVTDEVAEAIVRFVAGGSELAHAQVEPSLLSLICRELNDKRIAAGREAITMDLLAGSHASILSDFYERALADQPEAVRSVIEDVLLTESGYRENVAEERVRAALAGAGATPDALAKLVDRRLLRIEDRLDIRRVELTHDVLCGVVGLSRSQRLEREAHAATTRNLTAQEAAARDARKALVRARQLAVGGLVFGLCAIGGAGFGYVNLKQAQATRTSAEKLVGYLQDEFFDELKPIGRTEVLADLASRTASYYRGLPPAMRNPGSDIGLGRALVQLGQVRALEGKHTEASTLFDEAIAILTPLSARGGSETLDLTLSNAVSARSKLVFGMGNIAKSMELNERAMALAAPYATAPHASLIARRQYAYQLKQSGYTKMRNDDYIGARIDLKRACEQASDQGKISSDWLLAIEYNEARSWLHEAWMFGAKADQSLAEHYAHETLAGLENLLEIRPNHSTLLDIQDRVRFNLGAGAYVQRRQEEAQAWLRQGVDSGRRSLSVDPNNTRRRDNMAIDIGFMQMSAERQGKLPEARRQEALLWNIYDHGTASAFQSNNLTSYAKAMALVHAELGELSEMDQMMARLHKYTVTAYELQTAAVADVPAFLFGADELRINAQAGRPQANQSAAAALIRNGEQMLAKADTTTAATIKTALSVAQVVAARLAIGAGDMQSAEQHARAAVALTTGVLDENFDMVDARLELAMALAHLKRNPEALMLAKQRLDEQRRLLANSDDQMLRFETAQTLYALGLAKAGSGRAEMKEAAALLAGLPATLQAYRSVKLWRARVAAEL